MPSLLVYMRIGITGSIGSGKSSALQHFKKLSFQVLNADDLVKELLSTDNEVINNIKNHFGASVFKENKISNKALADLVFGNQEELTWLENQLHPFVIKKVKQSMEGNPQSNWAIEIPLLFEKNLASLFDYTVCISVNDDVRENRLMAKGFSMDDIGKRIAQQMPQSEKEIQADFVINNNDTEEAFGSKIQELVQKLSSNAS